MDIAALQRFLILSRNRTITKAAEEAFMSRQAFTDSILRLEDEMGMKLFNRDKKSIALTPAGQELSEFLKSWLPEWDNTLRSLQEKNNAHPKSIRIGVSFSNLSQAYYERMLEFAARNGNLSISYQDYPPGECFSLLENDELDAVFSLGIGDKAGMTRIRLPEKKIETLIMMHKTHPLAQKTELTTADLKGVPMVTVSKNMKPDPFLDIYTKPFGAIPIYVPLRNEAYTLSLMKAQNAVGLSSNRKENVYERDGFVRIPITDYPLDMNCYVYYKKTADAIIRKFAVYVTK